MAKRFVREHGSGRKIPVDLNPTFKAVLGQNIYLQDGTTLLDLSAFVNSVSTTGVATSPAPTPAPSATPSTQQKVLGRLPATSVTPTNFAFSTPAIQKGDILVHNGRQIVRLPVGANGTVLTARSTEADGVKWETPSAGGGSAPDFILQQFLN